MTTVAGKEYLLSTLAAWGCGVVLQNEIEIHTLEQTPAWTQEAAPYALPTNAVQAMRLPTRWCCKRLLAGVVFRNGSTVCYELSSGRQVCQGLAMPPHVPHCRYCINAMNHANRRER